MKETSIDISPMMPGDETEISELVRKVFEEFVGPEFSREGRRQFMSHADPERMRSDFYKGNTLLVARQSGKIRGVLEIRDNSHICMLFVDRHFHNKGIAKQLWQEAKRIHLAADPAITEFTVNASTYAIPAYEKLGFYKSGEKKSKDGFVFTPMKWSV